LGAQRLQRTKPYPRALRAMEMNVNPTTGLELRSLIKQNGELELSLVEVPVPALKPDEVLIRIEAAPINPSDLVLLLGAADMTTAQASGTPERPVITASVSSKLMKAMSLRVDKSMQVGNEGAGVVIAAGVGAEALVGKKVALLGGAMYAQYRVAKGSHCLVLPEDASCADGASCFVNPLTALGMLETMRLEGHTALVHTAAASNLGQMLNRICLKDGVELVNIVRKAEQAALLREIGARYIVDSSLPSFQEELTQALVATGATLAFDAVGGGKLASQILSGMEAAASLKLTEYSRYGSPVHKQVYIYGGLDRGPTELSRNFGLSWGVGGWLLTPLLQRIGAAGQQRLRARVVAELKTTFASHYTKEISLAQVLHLDVLASYAKFSTGEKFLVNPAR
jgi:NADPH2:quinone reductase